MVKHALYSGFTVIHTLCIEGA